MTSFFPKTNAFGGGTATSTFGSINAAPQNQPQQQQAQKDCEIPQCPTDTVTSLKFCPTNANNKTFLLAGAWDNSVRVWDVQSNGSVVPVAQQNADNAVFGVAWSADATKAFACGADKIGRVWDLQSNQWTPFAQHDAPIKTIHWVQSAAYQCVMTGGFDGKLKFWDLRTPTPMLQLDLPDRVYCAAVLAPLAVVATADRKVFTYNLESTPTLIKAMDSPLKFQSRCVDIFTDKATPRANPIGFALGCIEGRVAMQAMNPTNTRDTFTFKCHRSPMANKNVDIYSVNDLAFHPKFMTLATVGSDGKYTFWDKDARTRLHSSDNPEQPVTSCAFDATGNVFAYAIGYDWSKGYEYSDPNKKPRMMMRLCFEEMRPQKK